jgi:recombination DNA repair RAD52 pathway protein
MKHQQSNRHLAEWKKILTNCTYDKGLICRINNDLEKFNSKNLNNPIKNGYNRPK